MSTHIMFFEGKIYYLATISYWRYKQEAHGPRFAHLIKTAIAYLQMPCNILPVLSHQLGQKFDRALKKAEGHPRLKFKQTW